MTTITVLAFLTIGAADPEPEEVARPKLVVMPLQSSTLARASVATLDELLANSVRHLDEHDVIGQSDIDAMLGLENLKDQLGCDDVACAAEIGGALGAELLLAGQVAELGDSIIIVLKLINTQQQKVLNSTQYKTANDENIYDQAVETAVSQLFGRSAPPADPSSPPSGDLLRSFISEENWRRYVSFKGTTGTDVSLATWVEEQNEESWALFIGELAAGGMVLVSVGITAEYEPKIGGEAPMFSIIGAVALAGLLVVDILDIGSVEVIGM